MRMPTSKRSVGQATTRGCRADGSTRADSAGPTPEEMARRDAWVRRNLAPGGTSPFSFLCGGRTSDECLTGWTRTAAVNRLDEQRAERVTTWTDARSGLEVRCRAVVYRDFPAVEWTVYFKNTGKADTPLLEDIQGLDAWFQREAGGEFVLHGNRGDWCAAEGLLPWRREMEPRDEQRFAPWGGRPTNGPDGWPYYNVQMPGGGFILAVGWPGQWECVFLRDDARGLRVMAGQELTHLVLRPGEEIRTPLIALLFWKGADVTRAQNVWRRWMLEHNLPRVQGRLPEPFLVAVGGMGDIGARKFEEMIRHVTETGVRWNTCWIDAGWYPCGGQWWKTGTWEIDRTIFPDGFQTIGAGLHAQDKQLLVWFEPERIGDPDSWLARNHPEWLLGKLLNMGHPDARRWFADFASRTIAEQGIDVYRQDFNMDPLSEWRKNDAPDRQGCTENFHVQGYLVLWDELRRRHPHLWIDSCASGGRRDDLETLRRSLPLRRSDYEGQSGFKGGDAAVPMQAHTHALSAWFPYYGFFGPTRDTYLARSCYSPSYGVWLPADLATNAASQAEVRRTFDECARVAPFMILGDYYPLTPCGLSDRTWIAWQFDRPETGEGLVQAFRRSHNDEPRRVFRLRGLDPEARYEVSTLDEGRRTSGSGRDLMTKGLVVDLPEPRGAAILFYRRKKSKA